MAVLKNSSSQTNWPLIGGIVVVVIIIIVVAVVVFKKTDKSTPATDKEKAGGQGQGKISLNEIKDKVNDFQAGNAAAFKGGDLECYAVILFDNQDNLNVEAEKIYDILDSGGLKFNNYEPGLLSSISIVSKALKAAKPKPCEVFAPLQTPTSFKVAAAGTVFNSAGLEKVFKTGLDPVNEKYTEFSFLTFIYFLSNLYKEGKANSIYSPWDSNNLKKLNEQLIKANAFNPGTTPVEGGSSTVVSTPTATININISTPGGEVVTTKSPDGGDFNFDDDGGNLFDETTTEAIVTTTSSTTPKPKKNLKQLLEEDFAPFSAVKLTAMLRAKLEASFPKLESLSGTAKDFADILLTVGLTKAMQLGVKYLVNFLGSGKLMKVEELVTKLSGGDFESIWNKITSPSTKIPPSSAPSNALNRARALSAQPTLMDFLIKNTVTNMIQNFINSTVVTFIMDKAVNPALNAIEGGLGSIPMVGSFLTQGGYPKMFADAARKTILKILSDLAKDLGDWAADMVLNAATAAKEFFTKFMSSPITALKEIKAGAGNKMSSFTWSGLWSKIRKGFASALKTIVATVANNVSALKYIYDSKKDTINNAIDTYVGGDNTKEPYIEFYRMGTGDRNADHMIKHMIGVTEAYLDIGGFNKAVSKEEFSYLRPQLSKFANTQEFFTIMY